MQSPIATIITNNLESSALFYENILNFERDCLEELHDVTLLFMHHEHFTIEFVSRKEKSNLISGNTFILTFICTSFETIKNKLSSHNINDFKEIKLPSGIDMLRFSDPNGIMISFVKKHL